MAQKITSGLALRQLQQAQQAMKKVRKGLVQIREADPADRPQLAETLLKAGWETLNRTYRDLAAIPLDAATEEVMLRQIAVQRYATALLVRLRRLVRNDLEGLGGPDDDEE
ncbi:hypothetical protein AB1L88_01445 [Tautonia sp. JC769]|uniref:hypothetical protein n=1 Tax=Tautonia sp. JC769 TaxID=3232135 RepID=UPI003458C295